MKTLIVPILVLVTIHCFGQRVDEVITEENVARVVNTLSSDAMMGRPALRPAQIEPATVFIENEFKEIGLQTLDGLNGYRQAFEKERISPDFVQIIADGKIWTPEDMVIVSDQTEIDLSGNVPVHRIAFDSLAANARQYFFQKAFSFMRDTVSSIILIAPEFSADFKDFKEYFGTRFKGKKTNTLVFIIGIPAMTSYSVKATQKIEAIRMNNVVGIIKGKTMADEIVLFSAHYDHIGIRPAINGDSIANGADDDASGTTAVIELARYFKRAGNNDRTIIFVAFTAEEIGGYGSTYFSEQLDPEKVVAMFNMEMIGKLSKWGANSAFITGHERSDFGLILDRNLQGSAFSFKPDPYPEQNLFYRSDNATLARLGVPAHSISTDQIDIDQLYHTVDDEFESLDIKNMTNTIKAIAIGAKSIIDGTDTPQRIDKATVH